MTKRSMTLALLDREDDALEALAMEMDMSKTAILRAAFRLYQSVHVRVKAGETMAFVDKDGNLIKQEIIGCGH